MRSADGSGACTVLRQRSGPVITVVVWVFFAVLLGDALVRGAWATAAAFLPAMLLGAWIVFMLLWRPALIVAEDSVEIRDVLRTVVVPFTAITDIRLSSNVAIVAEADGRTVTFRPWNAPGRARRRTDSGLQGGKALGPMADHPSFELLQAWQRWEDDQAPGQDAATGLCRRWNLGMLGTAFILLLICGLSLI